MLRMNTRHVRFLDIVKHNPKKILHFGGIKGQAICRCYIDMLIFGGLGLRKPDRLQTVMYVLYVTAVPTPPSRIALQAC